MEHGISPADVLAAHGVTIRDSVPWGVKIRHSDAGVYLVGLHRDPADRGGLSEAPIDQSALREWQVRVPALRLRGEPVEAEGLATHIARWWLPNSSVLEVPRFQACIVYGPVPIGLVPRSATPWIGICPTCHYHLRT